MFTTKTIDDLGTASVIALNAERSPAVDALRIARAKAAYTTRRVDRHIIKTLLGGFSPRPGDLVLARVVKLGQHARIELEHGRRAPLFVGDEIIVCYGNRYAPDQFEAEVPDDLDECHLVAGGGIAARCLARHDSMKAATVIQPLGLLGDAGGRPINLADWALPAITSRRPRPLVLAVAGTAMNAGKTTSAAHLIKGLSYSGMTVGAAKVTGTGAGGDVWLMKDAGAALAFDFTDAGLASTYRAPVTEIEDAAERLLTHLREEGVDAIVLEVADGLFQQETAALLSSPRFRSLVDAVIFAAGDAMGAAAGVAWLRQRGWPVAAVSGCVSASPLAAREVREATGLPVLGLDDLTRAEVAFDLFERGGEWAIRSDAADAKQSMRFVGAVPPPASPRVPSPPSSPGMQADAVCRSYFYSTRESG